MKGSRIVLVCCAAIALFAGCMQYPKQQGNVQLMRMSAESSSTADVRSDRMLIWSAKLTVEVGSIDEAVAAAQALAERTGGFVEQKSFTAENAARLVLRIPAQSFKTALSDMEELGSVTARDIEGEDVTEQYIDVEARLKNKIVLRDRLTQLLAKATAVKDILAIETELNRVQADIDSMQGRIKSLKSRVDFATVRLNLERKPVLGPLGYAFKGLWWGIKKLFVLRD